MDDDKWNKVIDHLQKCEKAYTVIGTAGYFALTHVIRPLRDRVNKGERTESLAEEIMDVSL